MNAPDDRAARALLLRGFPEIDRHFALLMDDLASVPSDGLALRTSVTCSRPLSCRNPVTVTSPASFRLSDNRMPSGV